MTPVVCTRERIASLWADLGDFPALRHQMGMTTPEQFWDVLQDRHTVLLEGPGTLVVARDVIPSGDARVFFVATDHQLGGKEPLFLAGLGYLFRVLGLRRVTAFTPDDMKVLVKLVSRLGFSWEGVLRQGWTWGEAAGDMHINGLLREEWDAGRAEVAA